jgi:hypothetical protein
METPQELKCSDLSPTNLTPLTGQISEPVSPEKQPELTRKQIGQLRRQYITKVHGTVKACEHKAKFAKDKDPNNNCIYCWEAYFMTSVDLDFIHSVLTQKGAKALISMRGTKFVRMFHGFLSTKMLPMLAAEIKKTEAPVTIEGGTFGNTSTEIQAVGVTE